MDLNILATIEKITFINMLGSIPHKKFCFYHLPTRGRAGIKLGDAWYVSNVSIIFYCSMLLYYLFWMFNGLYYTLLYYFWVLQKRNTKRSPNELKLYGDFLWTRRSPRSKRVGPEEPRGIHKGGGRALPPGPPFLVDDPETPLTWNQRQKFL